jgi:putative phage-type endonuclease
MSRNIIRPKDRSEWLEFRKSGIGSSEIASVVGLNPWETPYQLWRRKTGRDEGKTENFAMKAGHYLEDAVSMFWHDETGRDVIKSSAGDWLIINPDKPFMRVSPDRTYWLTGQPHNERNKGILECKTTQMKIDGDDLPKHWFCQVQYQLGVAEVEQGSLAWLCSGREFGYKDIALVPDFFGWLAESADKFWTDYVLTDKEPESISVEDVMLKYNRHTDGKVIEVGQAAFDDYQSLRSVRAEIETLEYKKEQLESRLKMMFADAEAITHDGQTLATWKAPKPSEKFDSNAFKAAHPDIAKEFTCTYQGARRFILK